ncbi:hypothetical protein VTK73DRAFT_15 [Phialemonium thermophilum]|uniref:GRIP domain-containing protein n=1 Tax=Phialemonium thermophilum TaxID=223376 RepID=A0ABR3Y8Q2_9PEZI
MSSSATATADLAKSASSKATPSKKKNNRKKKNANKPKTAAEQDKDSIDENDGGEEGSDTETQRDGDVPAAAGPENLDLEISSSKTSRNTSALDALNSRAGPDSDTTAAKLETMSQEREALRQEVERLRRQLESLQVTHQQEVAQLKTELEESEAAKDHAETQFQTLLGRVEKIKETLGDRLKRDKAELEEANSRVEELETQNEELQKGSLAYQGEISRLKEELQEQARELASLRSRSNLSQQNWLKEKEDMARQVQHLKSELESATAAMGEWEVIAMEERSIRESLSDKVVDLEEQLVAARESYERAVGERDTQSQAIDGLQRALREIQDARKKELRETVESAEEQLQTMRKQVQEAESRAAAAEAAKECLSKELERTSPFEKEVKEKNLLIGKLRHEAIVLNDHLTKALKYIKKTRPEETIDRQIVTNHLLQFLSLDRSDPKKFQVLQIIAGLLEWTEEQREQAGLARPGTSGHTLRIPTSPFHRTPSSPALNSEFFSDPTSASGKESLADLWAGFLEKSVEEATANGAAASSRKGSMSSVGTGATRPDTRGHS